MSTYTNTVTEPSISSSPHLNSQPCLRDYTDKICHAFAAAKLPISINQATRAASWLHLLQRWNKTFNLTALSPEKQIVECLIVSAATLPHLLHGNIADVGTGAGIPGIALAILNPNNHYTLIDSNLKKIRFIKQCQMELQLDNITIVHDRVESLSVSRYASVISRAYSSLDTFLNTTRHLGDASTRWLTYKHRSDTVEAEIKQVISKTTVWDYQIYPLDFPALPTRTSTSLSLICLSIKDPSEAGH